MNTCPNGHGSLQKTDDTHFTCAVCGYSFVIAPRRADKNIEAVNRAIRDMLVEARISNETIPWKQPWITVAKRNYESGRRYTGINRWLLAYDPEIYYITHDSVVKRGLTTKEGAKLRFVIGFKPPSLTKKEKATLSEEEQVKALRRKRPFMLVHNVYMAKDVEGLPEKTLEEEQDHKRYDSIESFLKEVLDNSRIKFQEGGNKAVYSWDSDTITVPKISMHDTSEDYYRSVFHELAHASGHPSRLDREATKYKRTEEYGKEELIAEFAGAYMCHYFGIEPDKNVAGYIDGWLKAIDGDPTLLVSAAQRAEDVLKYFGLN